MRITLREKNSEGTEIHAEFQPEHTIPVQDLYLIMYCPNNYAYIGDNAEVKTNTYKQIFITKLLHIMYGKLSVNGKIYEVQVGSYLSDFNYRIESIFLCSDGIGTELEMRYNNFHSNLLGDIIIKVLDYKSYSDLVTKMGNEPLSFKNYVLRSFFNVNYVTSELDFYHINETSYFNEKATGNEEDFITIKGMKIYFEEILNNNV